MGRLFFVLAFISILGCNKGFQAESTRNLSSRPAPEGGSFEIMSVAKTYDVDLDLDGTMDTNLSTGTCASSSSHWCILLDSKLSGAPKEILVRPKTRQSGNDACRSKPLYEIQFNRPIAIGKHSGGKYQDISLFFNLPEKCVDSSVYYRPLIGVYSASTQKLIATSQSPVLLTDYYSYFMSGLSSAWVNPAETGVVRGPDGRFYPYILPGYGDSNQHGPGATYGFMCIFQVNASGDPGYCGKGFTPVITQPSPNYFREAGTYVGDLDGDNWEDITVLFHSQVLTISVGKVMNGQTPSSATVTSYNVSEADIPQSAPNGSLGLFHSGRNYGYHSLIRGNDGKMRSVMVGGSPVGDHNPFCNVSRFTAVLESSPGNLAGRRLAWSHYFGFNSNIFASTKSSQPNVAREGDFANGCLHVYENGLTKDAGNVRIHFNYFESARRGLCVAEQYLLYLTNWSPAANSGWQSCLTAQTEASPGSWNWRLEDTVTGAGVTGSPNTYVWGVNDRIFPGQQPFYVLEALPANVKFRFVDQNLDPAAPLRAQNLVNNLWSRSYALPRATKRLRPILVRTTPVRSIAADDQPFVTMSLKDVDGDGLLDFQVTDGDPAVRTSKETLRWVGYSRAQDKLVIKSP
jgi:hypothetical protein